MAQKVLPNHTIGLNSEKIDEMNVNFAVFKFVHGQKQAPIPKGTTGTCNGLRERILQMSLFPDIYDKRAKLRSPGNVDFGDAHTKANSSTD